MPDKIVTVEKDGETYLIKNLEHRLEPKFLARNPKDGELFLLLGDNGTYALFKGTEKKGLRICSPKHVQLFGDCFAFMFEQDGRVGEITDPDDLDSGRKPIFNDFGRGMKKLDVLPHKVVK
ncbi:MAG: hypothetical protein UX02_C0001G0002 [Candidatus Moranbacteria bacterium GW2011_GWC1_45_18]|nr:MAG: hypothetical protein US56_C0012G0002 [Candidatus Moranbacteria bacterium GW2011_GWF2_37_7]KKR44357.1 MAG: hypothetical protein UT79_C0002G0400 [Candidatus Moranbacteria bacterium GW2011_GWC2_40_12]KKU00554.1 MAG: hypothetical protein UX02_C0001G0002 [Candidatus Moranbacteria bacterium GW2011_GWC1_45_18]